MPRLSPVWSLALGVAAATIGACTAVDQPVAPDGNAQRSAVTIPPSPSTTASPTTTPGSQGAPLQPWPVHTIDARYKGANSLGPGDVNGDGFIDYVTAYEFAQRYVIAFHPGYGSVRAPWPTMDVFAPACPAPECGVNPEFAVLADLDGDGHLDVVAAQGWSSFPFWEGSQPGIRVIWGPPPEQATDPAAWVDGGRIPASAERGHPHFVQVVDLTGDGQLEVVVGGRVHGLTGEPAGLSWLEGPADPGRRRDLSAWVRHELAPQQLGGRNVLPVDLDGDGDLDLVLANADFDTPAEAAGIFWYEHPGFDDLEALRQPWREHLIYATDELHTKPQVVAADLDGDGLTDLLTQTPDAIWWLRARSSREPTFDLHRIAKAPWARWPARSLAVADLDGDGHLDVAGAMVHVEGLLPHDRTSVFWLRNGGDPNAPGNWSTFPIHWGAGHSGPVIAEFGEKWDLLHIIDVDGDGDLDVVANNEEWWEDGGRAHNFWDVHLPPVQALVWFENRLNEPRLPFAERDGVVSIEAEEPTVEPSGGWTTRSVVGGFSGFGYAQATAVVDRAPAEPVPGSGRAYDLEVDGGRYDVRLRMSVPSSWGQRLGAERSDSAWLGLDDGSGRWWLAGDDGSIGPSWTWRQAATGVELSPGVHRLWLHPREGGVRIDRIELIRTP